MQELTFTVYCKPEPQGSSKAFVVNGKARITSANAKLKPFRHTVAQIAAEEMSRKNIDLPFAAKHVPVVFGVKWVLNKPPSVPKKRTHPSVKPDADKLLRATFDSLTGIAWHDDAQVVQIVATKVYGAPERVEISVRPVVV